MNGNEIYEDIARRTDGQIYIGVVGPVRSGKSTFIKRFMETLVLPNIADESERERGRDELPQSAQGRTVMTTEPKFIPEKAVTVRLDGVSSFRVRMIDCVGFIIPGAEGIEENGKPRMVHTPWSDDPLPFDEAAETGTEKVIKEHSTIAMLVTTDGSIGDIPRENYADAERRTADELIKSGKPFAVILNCADTSDPKSTALAYELEEKYGAPVALVNCMQLDGEDVTRILEMVLPQFPLTEVDVDLPEYLSALGDGHEVNASIRKTALSLCSQAEKIKDAAEIMSRLTENENIISAAVTETDYGTGRVRVKAETDPALYYASVSEISGCDIRDDAELFEAVRRMHENEKRYGRYVEAIKQAESTGYGIAGPDPEDLKIDTPQIVKQTGGYGVRLKVAAHTTHMIGVDVLTEINPVVGTEQQSNDLVRFLTEEYDADPGKLWETNMFGRTLRELADEGLSQKASRLSEQTRLRFAETLQRVINEGGNGMICIIL